MTQDFLLTEEKPARRGFLRNLILAPAAALATHKLIVPAQALVTPADASARLKHHLEGLQAAFRDLYPQGEIATWGHPSNSDHAEHLANFIRGDLEGAHTVSM